MATIQRESVKMRYFLLWLTCLTVSRSFASGECKSIFLDEAEKQFVEIRNPSILNKLRSVFGQNTYSVRIPIGNRFGRSAVFQNGVNISESFLGKF